MESKYLSNLKSVGHVQLSYVKDDGFEYNSVQFTSPKLVEEFMRPIYGNDIYLRESLYLIMMSKGGKFIGFSKVSDGGTDCSVADIKHICITALLANATRVILVHNHPFGTPNPSKADIDVTRRVKAAFNLLDIQFMDHIILTDDSYYSFRDHVED